MSLILQWGSVITGTAQSASDRELQKRKSERAMRIARELSNLVIYCRYDDCIILHCPVVGVVVLYLTFFCIFRSVVFQLERAQKRDPRTYQEMSSFPESKAELFMFQTREAIQTFLWYHQVYKSYYTPLPSQHKSSLILCMFKSGPVEPSVPQGPADGLVQLQPHADVERGLADGSPQLPDRRQAHAA